MSKFKVFGLTEISDDNGNLPVRVILEPLWESFETKEQTINHIERRKDSFDQGFTILEIWE